MDNTTAAHAATGGEHASEALALSRACTALWVATLSLMTAFMHNTAPAHRLLIARKIARNLATLQQEDRVFTAECRMIFANLAQRWSAKAEQLARGEQPGPRLGLLRRVLAKAP